MTEESQGIQEGLAYRNDCFCSAVHWTDFVCCYATRFNVFISSMQQSVTQIEVKASTEKAPDSWPRGPAASRASHGVPLQKGENRDVMDILKN